MNTECVSVDVVNHVALATMHRAPVNAVNEQFLEDIISVFDALSADDDVRAVVLTGHGKTFCAGADLKDSSRGRDVASDMRHSRRASDAFFTIMTCRKPTIAAINGGALGAGLALVASCDILIASDNAFLALPEVGVGLLGGARHAMRLVGHSMARRMMLTGRRVPATELYRVGSIERCVPQESLLEEARKIADEIAGKDPAVVQLAKQALNATEGMALRDGYAYEQALTTDLLAAGRKKSLGS